MPNAFGRGGLLVKQAIGRLRRKTTQYPTSPVITRIRNAVRFEHKRLPFLTFDNQLAMLTETYDILLDGFLRRHLQAGDIVIDGGANVGYVSAVAGAYVGRSGEVHGFEPMLECYQRLQVLASLNPDYRFSFHNAALADTNGVLQIASPESDARNATLVPGKDYKDTRQVDVKRLDDYIAANVHSPEKVSVIKLDVQGYEYPVLLGLERFFTGTNFRPVIACDMKPWEIRNIGHTLEEFEKYMAKYGYRAYDIADENVPVNLTSLTEWQAVVFKA